MAIKIVKYSKDRVMMYPNGIVTTGETMAVDYPAITIFPHIIETDDAEQVCYAIENLAAARSRNNIDSALTDDEAIAEIERLRNEQLNDDLVKNVEPTVQERIAAALEFQNLLAMESI